MARFKKTWDASPDDMWTEFEAGIKGESIRGQALIYGAVVEDALMRLLRAYLAPGKPTEALFAGMNSPFGSWAAKASAAYAVGLISADELLANDLLRDIRNMFAHYLNPIA
jgi:hypothetical protein